MSRRKRTRYHVAVVGATGAVGTEMLRVLEARRFPIKSLRLLASRRSAGRRITSNGVTCRVEELRRRSFDGIDLALFSAGADRSRTFAPEAVRRGAVVVDNSSAFRMAAHVPLVVPEVNAHVLASHEGLIANPNCSTILMVLALAPLHKAGRLKRVVVSTYQSVSGAGARAMWQLFEETRDIVRQMRGGDGGGVGRRGARLERLLHPPRVRRSRFRVLPGQIACNVLPQVDAFLADGSTKEEMKMVQETQRILEAPSLAVSATCVRVPVFVGHAEAVWVETERPLSPERARMILRRAPGVALVDRPSVGDYPSPLDAAGQPGVLVGRVRRDASVRHGLAFWVCGDNLLKGAATNAIQIAELALRR